MTGAPSLSELKVKIFADGADLDGIREMSADSLIKGFTTNPTLMRRAGDCILSSVKAVVWSVMWPVQREGRTQAQRGKPQGPKTESRRRGVASTAACHARSRQMTLLPLRVLRAGEQSSPLEKAHLGGIKSRLFEILVA